MMRPLAMTCEPGYILLIEDNSGDVMLTRMALEKAGITGEIEIASDGDQALRAIGSGRVPILILLDLNLPGADADILLSAIHSNSHLKDVPVVVLSSSMARVDSERAKRLSRSMYISKPSELDAYLSIGDRIRKFLQAESNS